MVNLPLLPCGMQGVSLHRLDFLRYNGIQNDAMFSVLYFQKQTMDNGSVKVKSGRPCKNVRLKCCMKKILSIINLQNNVSDCNN